MLVPFISASASFGRSVSGSQAAALRARAPPASPRPRTTPRARRPAPPRRTTAASDRRWRPPIPRPGCAAGSASSSSATSRSSTSGRTPEWPQASEASRAATTAAASSSASGAPVPQPWKRNRLVGQRVGQLGRHLGLARFAHAGRHAVDDAPGGELPLQAGAARLEARAVLGLGAQRGARPPLRDVADLLERQRPARRTPPSELAGAAHAGTFQTVVEVEPVVGRQPAVVLQPLRRSAAPRRAPRFRASPRGSSIRSANGSQ